MTALLILLAIGFLFMVFGALFAFVGNCDNNGVDQSQKSEDSCLDDGFEKEESK